MFGGKLVPDDTVKTYDELSEHREVLLLRHCMMHGSMHIFVLSCTYVQKTCMFHVANSNKTDSLRVCLLQECQGLVKDDKDKAERKLATVRGTLVPMQYHFMENDLEVLRKPRGWMDVRRVPDRWLGPMLKGSGDEEETDQLSVATRVQLNPMAKRSYDDDRDVPIYVPLDSNCI